MFVRQFIFGDTLMPTATLANNTDTTRNFHRGNRNSTAANPSRSSKKTMVAQILGQLKRYPAKGRTCDEIEVALSLPHTSVSARLRDLKNAGKVRVAGRRPTRSGRVAGVNFLGTPSTVTLNN
jgi:DNA-binding transcriptional ArsR family regulator